MLFHRTQAATLAKLEDVGAEARRAAVNRRAPNAFRDLFSEYDADDQYDEDEMVQRLLRTKRKRPRSQITSNPALSELVVGRRRGRRNTSGRPSSATNSRANPPPALRSAKPATCWAACPPDGILGWRMAFFFCLDRGCA